MAPEFLFNGPEGAPLTIVLGHGAGAPMDSPFMVAFAEGLAERGHRVARFEFPYMVKRRETGTKRPPDRAPVLLETWREAIGALGGPENLIIGGKSMGGRIASMITGELETAGTPVRGLACLGYPFHAPGRPENVRTEHLAALQTPSLFLQGTRDTLGSREDVAGYTLSPAITLHWLEDGDHGFKPRVKSGLTEDGNWSEAIEALAAFADGLS